MTADELQRVQRELDELEGSGRSEMAKRIKTAREWGDLKENAEYHAAKEAQAHLETRIKRLREQIRGATIVEPSSSGDVVGHGSSVSYTDRRTNQTHQVRIVSSHDAKPGAGALSAASPVAKALIGRRIGDKVQVQTPAGVRELTHEAIS
jgi:transcription elongation factor GreA